MSKQLSCFSPTLWGWWMSLMSQGRLRRSVRSPASSSVVSFGSRLWPRELNHVSSWFSTGADFLHLVVQLMRVGRVSLFVRRNIN